MIAIQKNVRPVQGSPEDADWKESEPHTRTREFSIHVKDVFEKADGETVYMLEVEVEQDDRKFTFRAAMTPKGKFLFYSEEDRKEFLITSDGWRSLYLGLAFPKLPNDKAGVGDEYASPDFIMAYHRDYNLFFAGHDVFVNDLEIEQPDKDSPLLLLKGSKKGKFENRNIEYDYDVSKSYMFDTEKRIVTSGKFHRKKGRKAVVPDPEVLPRRSDSTWEAKLISINGKKVD